MRPRVATVLALFLIATTSTAGCLSALWNDPDAAGGEPYVAEPEDAPPLYGAGPADAGNDNTHNTSDERDHWAQAYALWRACPRTGGPIDPCPHPHPETSSPTDTYPMVQRLSVRHHVSETRWIAVVEAVHQDPLRFQDVRLDVQTPDAQGTMIGQALPTGGALYFYVNQSGTCADCGYSVAMSPTPFPVEDIGYRVTIDDIDTDGLLSAGDRFIVARDSSRTTNTFVAPLIAGSYMVRLDGTNHLSQPSDRESASHSQLITTSDMRAPGWTVTVRHDFGTDTPQTSSARIEMPNLDVAIVLPDDGNTSHTLYITDYAAIRHGCQAHDTCVTATPPTHGPAFRVTFHDANGDGRYTLDDHIQIDHDVGNRTYGERTWNHPLPFGDYQIELIDVHDRTMATGTGTVFDGRTP